jgi:hypothetical protein
MGISITEEKKKRIRGFAGIVSKQIEPLNSIKQFKDDFKDKTIKILLNPKDGKNAALLIIENGKVYVEAVDNKDKSQLKKKVVGWDGLLQTTTQTFVELLSGDDLSVGSVVGKILTFKIKIRGIKNVLVLLKLFEYDEEPTTPT